MVAFTFDDIAPNKYCQFIENRKKYRQDENLLINDIKSKLRLDDEHTQTLLVPKESADRVKQNIEHLESNINEFIQVLDARSKLLNDLENLINRLPPDSPIDCKSEFDSWNRSTNDENGMKDIENRLGNWVIEQNNLHHNIAMHLDQLNDLEFSELESE